MRFTPGTNKIFAFCLLPFAFCLLLAAPTVAGIRQEEKKQKPSKDQKDPKKGDTPKISAETPEYADPDAGIKFTKPFPEWQVLNTGPDVFIQRILCLPPGEEVDRFSPRFVVLIYPAGGIIGGMEFRRQQVQNVAAEAKVPVHQVKFEKTTLAGKEAVLYSYDLALFAPLPAVRTVEYGVINQNNYYIVQASAPVSEWEKPEVAAYFEKTINSVSFIKAPPHK